MNTANQDTLYLGLCLAGAVSAGAYTAGVMDYLFEALGEWEQHKEKGKGPTHKVLIPAIGGASAGGMTGIIAASMVNRPFHPLEEILGDLTQEFPENKLYHSWVDMLDWDMFSYLLKSDDINGKVESLFNSNFIDEIAQRAIQIEKESVYLHPFIDRHLKVFTTLTNLKGLSYNTQFISEADESAFHFTRHSDFAAFKLNADEYNNDGWIPLDFFENTNVDIAKQAAMATGAFPIGLKARTLEREGHFINDFKWNENITRYLPVPNETLSTLCVDGGVINNEPFYRVKQMLEIIAEMKSKGREEPTMDEVEEQSRKEMGMSTESVQESSMDTFNRTTLMIDPFPSVNSGNFNPASDILSVAGKTLQAMLSQIRLKPESLHDINDEDNPGLYLIAPVRYEEQNGKERKVSGSRALACGFLGGFGGFLHKEFRIHDFFLGRSNCERFLREYFTVPINTTNPIFKNGYEHVDDIQRFTNEKGDRLQVIPIFKKARPKPYMPVFSSGGQWPRQDEEFLNQYASSIDYRVERIIVRSFKLNWVKKMGYRLLLRGVAGKKVLATLKKQMQDWDLLLNKN